ncbi:hypothetical protein P7K49_034456 [Saguinus oedipus]|uniref:Uncharacterized protein n=1 Tax=Saguinus oedipus TaxID=9490 RepID=A0ABQ9TUT1_SAGOE|nr:hypothetical protein P7K49_034456 [Saguinus oedipus]
MTKGTAKLALLFPRCLMRTNELQASSLSAEAGDQCSLRSCTDVLPPFFLLASRRASLSVQPTALRDESRATPAPPSACPACPDCLSPLEASGQWGVECCLLDRGWARPPGTVRLAPPPGR